MRRHMTALVALVVTVILATGAGMAQNEAEFGNNLAVPVVFAEGYGIGGELTSTSNGLRGQKGLFNINGATPTTCFDTVGNPVNACYLQQTISDWQADWVDGVPAKTDADGKRTPGEAVIVNWSDNLISQRWTPKAPIRVEVVLYQNRNEAFPTFGNSMTGFNMFYNSGKGSTEMWGTDGTKSSSDYRTVFSVNARLKIEKLNTDGTIDTGTTAACGFNGSIWEAFGQDGPGFYAAEINVSGNLIYGFNWMLNQCDATVQKPEGKWRLTFMLDPAATLPGGTTVEPNVNFAGLDPADITIDESERAPYATPALVDGHTSVMDIQIVAPKGGGGSSRKTETEFGNNLAVPAVFAEGYGLGGERTTTSNGLRGLMGAFHSNGVSPVTCYDTAGLPVPSCYLQQTAADWQAQTVDGAPATNDPMNGRIPGENVIVNWSDNLISQRWTAGAPVRVEVVLYQNAGFPTFGGPMMGFNMLYNSGKGSTEMWGTQGSETWNTYRTVFSINARLKIEKLTSNGTIDAATTAACGFNGSIWEGFGKDGPGFYVAEVNVSGNLIYGFNWMLNRCDATTATPEGPWRLTFSLDPTAIALDGTAVQPNVRLAGLDPADITSTDGERAPYAIPILVNDSTSVLNIQIVSARGGGSSRRPR